MIIEKDMQWIQLSCRGGGGKPLITLSIGRFRTAIAGPITGKKVEKSDYVIVARPLTIYKL